MCQVLHLQRGQMFFLSQDVSSEPGVQGGQGIPSGNFFKKLGEFSRDDSLLEYSTPERSPPMQGNNPEFENSAELRHPTNETEPDQVSQVSGHQIPAMGHDSPAFQAEINEKIPKLVTPGVF